MDRAVLVHGGDPGVLPRAGRGKRDARAHGRPPDADGALRGLRAGQKLALAGRGLPAPAPGGAAADLHPPQLRRARGCRRRGEGRRRPGNLPRPRAGRAGQPALAAGGVRAAAGGDVLGLPAPLRRGRPPPAAGRGRRAGPPGGARARLRPVRGNLHPGPARPPGAAARSGVRALAGRGGLRREPPARPPPAAGRRPRRCRGPRAGGG